MNPESIQREIAELRREFARAISAFPLLAHKRQVRLAKTAATETYPESGNVFEIMFVNVEFEEEEGAQEPDTEDRTEDPKNWVCNLSSVFIPEGTLIFVVRHDGQWWTYWVDPSSAIPLKVDKESPSDDDYQRVSPNVKCAYSATLLSLDPEATELCPEPSDEGQSVWVYNAARPDPGYLIGASVHHARDAGRTFDPDPGGIASDERPLYEINWEPPGQAMVTVEIVGDSPSFADGELVEAANGCKWYGVLKTWDPEAGNLTCAEPSVDGESVWVQNAAEPAPSTLRVGSIHWARYAGTHDPDPEGEASDIRPLYEIVFHHPEMAVVKLLGDSESSPDWSLVEPNEDCIFSGTLLDYLDDSELLDGFCPEPSEEGDDVWLVNAYAPSTPFLVVASKHRARYLHRTYDPDPEGSGSDPRPLYEIVAAPPQVMGRVADSESPVTARSSTLGSGMMDLYYAMNDGTITTANIEYLVHNWTGTEFSDVNQLFELDWTPSGLLKIRNADCSGV